MLGLEQGEHMRGGIVRAGLAAALLLALALAPARAEEPLRGVALVIGQSAYKTLAPLDNARRDARGMDDLLDTLGFEVTRVLDADADELRRELADFVDEAAGADAALVYYAGHGVELGGRNFLLPTDTDLRSPEVAGASLVPVADLLEALARTVPVTIVLLDACRTDVFPSGQLFALPGAPGPLSPGGPGLGEMRGPTPVTRPGVPPETLGLVIGFAASPGQPALDGPAGGNSPYAAALLKHLSAYGHSFADVMTMVAEEVYLRTERRQLPWVNSSLRRVLTFGGTIEPTGGDENAIRDGRRRLLLSISGVPQATRAYVETVARSEAVPLDALYGMLMVLDVDTSLGARDLEQQLREGARQLHDILARAPGGVKTDAELERLAGLAREAEAEGAIDLALAFRERASVRAMELSSVRDDLEALLRADRLEIAATYAEHADTAVLNFDYAKAAEMFERAYGEVARWDDMLALRYKWDQAGALKADGDFRGDNAALERAIATYRAALAMAPRDTQPEAWAGLQNNLGNALELLSGRTGERALLEQAIAAFHAALEIYSPEDMPLDWAMVQNNLGIALTDIGLGERGTQALEAATVALRAALAERRRDLVPLDWATTMNNLGTALKLLGDRSHDPAHTEEAVAAFRAALGEYTETATPLDWAMTQNNLGNALAMLAEHAPEGGHLEAALAAYDGALREYRRDRTPLEWAMTQQNRGIALKRLGEISGDVQLIEAAIAAYRLALEEYRRDRTPMQWAMTNANLGNALLTLSYGGGGPALLDEAIAAYDAALEVYRAEDSPNEWGSTAGVLAGALLSRAMTNGDDPDLLDTAIAQHRLAATGIDAALEPGKWAWLHQSLALALDIRAEQRGDAGLLDEAIAAAHEAQQSYAAAGQGVSEVFTDWLAGLEARRAAMD